MSTAPEPVKPHPSNLPHIAPGTKCSRYIEGQRCSFDAIGVMIFDSNLPAEVAAHSASPVCGPCAKTLLDKHRGKVGPTWIFRRVVPAFHDLDLIAKVRTFIGSALADEWSDADAMVTMDIAEGIGVILEANAPDFAIWRAGCGYAVRADGTFEYLTEGEA